MALQSTTDDDTDGDLVLGDDDVNTVQSSGKDKEPFFDTGYSDNAFAHFKALMLMRYGVISNLLGLALKVVEPVQLGKLEKGEVSSAGHSQSRNAR